MCPFWAIVTSGKEFSIKDPNALIKDENFCFSSKDKKRAFIKDCISPRILRASAASSNFGICGSIESIFAEFVNIKRK